ncbi:hypothetical protein [Salinibacterium sp. ZJ454]|uniref:hypothetical protein n=1 Tax=Salinibacterium sp. ZJ454 TaxID=2708339 RepID=UPI00141FD719|nr:hypothetical protein [Salinibacterium sp. ZJ454]
MPDLTSTISALQALATDPNIAVSVDGTRVIITQDYRDTSDLYAGRGDQKAWFAVDVTLDAATGEYSKSFTQRSTASGANSGGLFGSSEVRMSSGYVRTIRKEKGVSTDGAFDTSFDSKQLETAVERVLTETGWTKTRGFWGRLFGR